MSDKYVICLLCNESFRVLAPHLSGTHKIDTFEYRRRFPGADTIAKDVSAAMSATYKDLWATDISYRKRITEGVTKTLLKNNEGAFERRVVASYSGKTTLTSAEKQWITGFWEGDGSLYNNYRGYIRVEFAQKERQILDYIMSLIPGGNAYIYKTCYQLKYSNFPILDVFTSNVVSKHRIQQLETITGLVASSHTPTIDWLAGFFDAEGSSDDTPSITLSQKDQTPLEAVKSIFGGGISSSTEYSKWYISSDKARELGNKLLQHSHNTKKAAKLREYLTGLTYYEKQKISMSSMKAAHKENLLC